jgi:formylglycine-generating enzyme required for sulfatase activity
VFHVDWEGPRTGVIISRGFWMGKFEVTQREYLALTGKNPSYWSSNYYGHSQDLDRPVEMVSWFDATNYALMLTLVAVVWRWKW